MATAERRRDQGTGKTTHEVFNQSPPLADYNLFEADRVLREAVQREGAEWAEDEARELGAICGRPDVIAMGRRGEREPPRCSAPTTASALASTRSSSTPPGTS